MVVVREAFLAGPILRHSLLASGTLAPTISIIAELTVAARCRLYWSGGSPLWRLRRIVFFILCVLIFVFIWLERGYRLQRRQTHVLPYDNFLWLVASRHYDRRYRYDDGQQHDHEANDYYNLPRRESRSLVSFCRHARLKLLIIKYNDAVDDLLVCHGLLAALPGRSINHVRVVGYNFVHGRDGILKTYRCRIVHVAFLELVRAVGVSI